MPGWVFFLTGIRAISVHCAIASGSRGDEAKEVTDGGEPTVAFADGRLPAEAFGGFLQQLRSDVQIHQRRADDFVPKVRVFGKAMRSGGSTFKWPVRLMQRIGPGKVLRLAVALMATVGPSVRHTRNQSRLHTASCR